VMNAAPVVDAGGPYTAQVDSLIRFVGQVTDPGTEDTHEFQWKLFDGSSITGQRFELAFSEPGTFFVVLLVIDQDGNTGVDTTEVTITYVSAGPIADALHDRLQQVGEVIQLPGHLSTDPEEDALTYEWTQIGGTSVRIFDYQEPVASFTAEEPGIYHFRLEVNDGTSSGFDEVMVTVYERPNIFVEAPIYNVWCDDRRTGWTATIINEGPVAATNVNVLFVMAERGSNVQSWNADIGTMDPGMSVLVTGSLFRTDCEPNSGSYAGQVRYLVHYDLIPGVDAGERRRNEGLAELIREPNLSDPDLVASLLRFDEKVWLWVLFTFGESWLSTEGRDVINLRLNELGITMKNRSGGWEMTTINTPAGHSVWYTTGNGDLQIDSFQKIGIWEETESGWALTDFGREVTAHIEGIDTYLNDGRLADFDLQARVDVPVTGVILSDPYAGYRIAFWSNREPNPGIYTMRADGSDQRLAVSAPATNPRWTPEGKLTYQVTSTDRPGLFEVNFDGTSARLITTFGATHIWSPDMSRLAYSYRPGGERGIYVSDAGNLNQETFVALGRNPTWSFDGTRLAYDKSEGGVLVYDFTNGTETQLTRHGYYPRWSPVDERILFHSREFGDADVFVVNAQTSDQQRLTTVSPGDEAYADWSHDGTMIVFESQGRDGFGGENEIYIMSTDGGNQRNLTQHTRDDNSPVWSPIRVED